MRKLLLLLLLAGGACPVFAAGDGEEEVTDFSANIPLSGIGAFADEADVLNSPEASESPDPSDALGVPENT
ncbi:MAG: hypothetical protein LBF66_02140 [Holosporales bacterium]|jgi:hypothetical protein|nr:hypothetical protein [Holosporales bacterium]